MNGKKIDLPPIQSAAILAAGKEKTFCRHCIYMMVLKDPGHIGTRLLSCRRNPPQIVLLPGRGGVQLTPMFPPVGEDDNSYCYSGRAEK